MTDTILVTGGTGNIGRHLVEHLRAAGVDLRVLARRPGAAALLPPGTEVVPGDLTDPPSLAAALAGVDRVFLLTTQSSRQPEWERAVIGAAARAGVGQLVKLSVFRADEQSPLQVARQHGQAERVLAQSGLAATILRPVFFMQNLLAMVHDGAIATAAGDGRVAMVDARDIAAVAVATLTGGGHAGKTYTLTGPEALTFYQVASILSRQTGRPLRHVRVPPDKVRVALQGRGVAAWYADDMAKLHSMLAVGYEEVVTDDIHRVTGRPPRTLAQFAGDHAGVLTRPPAGS
jgi:uncharacterized protein YbjT (DUF2867 family)